MMCFCGSANSFIIEEIKSIADWGKEQAKEASDALWKNSMLANTVSQLTQLKKNYDDAQKFQDEVKRYQENPNNLKKDVSDNINPNDYAEIAKGSFNTAWNNSYNSKESDTERAFKTTDKYIKDNYSYGTKFAKYIEDSNKEMAKIKTDLKSNNKDVVESAKLQLELEKLRVAIETELLLKQMFDMQNATLDLQHENDKALNVYRDELNTGISKLLTNDKILKNDTNELNKMVGELPYFYKPGKQKQ